MNGALIINKPAGLTSHDVVARVRRLSGERSVGHLGTLDPGATGVLPLLLGRLTRLAQFFQGRDKEYCGELRFGFATTTYDAWGEPEGPVLAPAAAAPAAAAVAQALLDLRGTLRQTPPVYSAKRVGGQRAYALARRQQAPRLAPVAIEVSVFESLELAGDRMRFRVVCASGTYVRSLAHDLGAALGLGAHLTQLERTRVGEFTLADARTLEELAALATPTAWHRALVAPLRLLPELPAVLAAPDAAARLRQGRAANLPEFSNSSQVRVFTPVDEDEGEPQLLALATRVAGSLFHPRLVFPPG